MSSHREAPEIAKDPVADSTDVYAFVSPDRPDTVTLIANYVPLQEPAGGPNFYEFGDDVLYEINIANAGRASADVTYSFRFTTDVRNPDTFLYNTGQITSLDDEDFNRRQFYSVTRRVGGRGDAYGRHDDHDDRDDDRDDRDDDRDDDKDDDRGRREDRRRRGRTEVLARRLPSPPCNVGPRSTPDYAALAATAVHDLGGGRRVFAGQRAEGFYVDLGAIFDLGALRPVQDLHLLPMAAMDGVNATKNLNVHTIALQVPISDLTRDGSVPTDVDDPAATIGVWTAAYRRRARVFDDRLGAFRGAGAFTQVSRLGNPLFNEVVVPMGLKDEWNSDEPRRDRDYLRFVQRPELARLLPVLYPGVFPNLAALDADRADLVAILLTGLPSGVVPGLTTFTGPTQADLLRLNVAVPPAAAPDDLGVLGGDLAGFPNGRRPADDVVTIEVRAIAGATYPLVAPDYTPDPAALAVTQGVAPVDYLDAFPYLGTPKDGFSTPAA